MNNRGYSWRPLYSKRRRKRDVRSWYLTNVKRALIDVRIEVKTDIA
jgi:hypothetical protein